MPPSSSPPPESGAPPSSAELEQVDPRLAYRQSGSPANFVLIAVSVLVTLHISWGEDRQSMWPLLISLSRRSDPGALSEVMHGQFWRLWTPMFLHYSVTHLGFNMMGMYNLGGPLEKVGGTRTYLVLCLTLALLSNLGQYLVNGSPYFGGMSGVLYGLFGYILMRGRFDPNFILQLPTETTVIALVWFVACFTGVLGPIGNASHTTGLVVGAIWGAVAGRAAARRLPISKGPITTGPGIQ